MGFLQLFSLQRATQIVMRDRSVSPKGEPGVWPCQEALEHGGITGVPPYTASRRCNLARASATFETTHAGAEYCDATVAMRELAATYTREAARRCPRQKHFAVPDFLRKAATENAAGDTGEKPQWTLGQA
jgi:hypothetical protein